MLLDFGETVETLGGAYITAEDVGTSEPDMRVISEVTPHVTGLAVESGGSGDPSPWTALGVEAAIRVACERAFGTAVARGPQRRRRRASATSAARSPSCSPRPARSSSSPTSTTAGASSPTGSARVDRPAARR